MIWAKKSLCFASAWFYNHAQLRKMQLSSVKLVLLILETLNTTSQHRAHSLIILEMSLLKTSAIRDAMPVVITAYFLSLFLHLRACMETFHAHMGDLISVQVKPSNFTGPSGLRNASVWGQENGCKTFTLFFSPDRMLTTLPQNSDNLCCQLRCGNIIIHTVNCGVFSLY